MTRKIAFFFVGISILTAALVGVQPAIAAPGVAGYFPSTHNIMTDGIIWKGPRGYPNVHLGGLFALDYLAYDSRNTRDSGLRFDRALIILDGALSPRQTWRLAGDLKGIDTRYGLEEAWFSQLVNEWLRVTIGLMEIPLGVEYSICEADLPFVGYSFASFLNGRTDIGIRFDGEVEEGLFSYDIVAAAGLGFDFFGQKRGEPQLSARVVFYPFRSSETSFTVLDYDIPVLSGIFIGASFAYTPSFDSQLDVANPLRNKLFNTPRLDADSSRFFNVSFGIDGGPFRIYAEKVQGSLFDLETAQGKEDLEDQITAWQATFSWMVTGEHYDSRPFRQRKAKKDFPARPFGGNNDLRDFGALEVAVRYSNADMDRDFFNFNVTDYGISSQEFRAFTVATNWYPITNVRVTAEVVRTIADDDPIVFGSQERDSSFVFRFQYAF